MGTGEGDSAGRAAEVPKPNLQQRRFVRSGLEPPSRCAEGLPPHSLKAPAPLFRAASSEAERSTRTFGGILYPQFPRLSGRLRERAPWSRLQIPWASAKWVFIGRSLFFSVSFFRVPGEFVGLRRVALIWVFFVCF